MELSVATSAKEVEAKEVAGHGAGEATKPSPTL